MNKKYITKLGFLGILIFGVSITSSCKPIKINFGGSNNNTTVGETSPITIPDTTVINPETNIPTTVPTTTVIPSTTVLPTTVVTTSTNEEATKVSSGGYNEGLYYSFNPKSSTALSDYVVKYKKSTDTTYTKLDSELLRDYDGEFRFDVVGIKYGKYDIQILYNDKVILEEKNILVSEADRSGYAHFNNIEGVGAYNNDGTLKSGAVVVYVNNQNKNTVTAKIDGKTYTGLSNILKAQAKSKVALDVRIIDMVDTQSWNYVDTVALFGKSNTDARVAGMTAAYFTGKSGEWDGSKSTSYYRLYEDKIISLGFNTLNDNTTKLEGLTNYINKSKTKDEFDSYFNELDIEGAKNLTIEGIGNEASIKNFGIVFNKCNSIEVKNLKFVDYPEDALGIQGEEKNFKNYGNYWIHNCTFEAGKNYWDLTKENDKEDGDGSSDFKYAHGLTISYCKYVNTHKSCLIGSSDSSCQYDVTLHHNYYINCNARLPLCRQANVHMYNNYYYLCATAQDIRANAFAFSEYNYFEGCNTALKLSTGTSYPNTVIKSFNNVLVTVSGAGKNKDQSTIVTNRTEALDGKCTLKDQIEDRANFDTSTTYFYYDSVNKKSDVMYLTDANKAKEDAKKYSGSGTILGPVTHE